MKNQQRGGIVLQLIVLLALLGMVGLLYLVRHPLFRWAGEAWVVDQGPTKADAIVVLSDDDYQADRARRAAELYHAGWAPQVVASGRMLRPYASIADLMQRDLKDQGVPARAIVRFGNRAQDTIEEALAVRELVEERGWHRVLVVTSNYHTRRTGYIYRKVFPREIEVRVVSAPDAGFNPERWWETRRGVSLFFHEAAGYGAAVWELRHGAASLSPAAPVALAPARS